MTLHVIGFLLLLQGTSTVRSNVPAKPTVLVPSVRVLEAPAFPIMGSAQCDKYGNMYFHVGNDFSNTDILRLAPDGKEGARFKLAGEFANKTNFASYSVSPEGEVYVFAGLQEKWEPLLFHFDSKGEAGTPVKVDLPEQVVDDDIMAFDSGAIFFWGHYDEPAPEKLRGQPYVALVDPSGRTILRLRSLPISQIEEASLSDVHEGGGTVAEDGNLYFLSKQDIVVISQTGNVIRRLRFEKPDPKSTAIGIRVSAGLAAIVLAIPLPDVKHGVKLAYLVVDTFSGDVRGYYELPDNLRSARDVCFSRKEGLSFIGPESGQMKLITAPLR